MVAVRLKLACTKFLLARYFDSVAGRSNRNSHAAQIAGQCVNAVRFFDAQLGSVAHNQTFFTDGAQYGKDRDLINDGSSCGTFDGSAANARGSNLKISNQLPIRLLYMEQLDRGTHTAQDVQHGGPSGIQPDV